MHLTHTLTHPHPHSTIHPSTINTTTNSAPRSRRHPHTAQLPSTQHTRPQGKLADPCNTTSHIPRLRKCTGKRRGRRICRRARDTSCSSSATRVGAALQREALTPRPPKRLGNMDRRLRGRCRSYQRTEHSPDRRSRRSKRRACRIWSSDAAVTSCPDRLRLRTLLSIYGLFRPRTLLSMASLALPFRVRSVTLPRDCGPRRKHTKHL